MRNQLSIRIALGVLGAAGLIVVFLFQKVDLAGYIFTTGPLGKFMINRTIRFLLNDAFAIAIIFALFREKKYLIFSLWVQLIGVIFILAPYFVLKIYFPTYNGAMISYLHRLIMNPTLLLLLIPAFYFQKKTSDAR